MGAINTNNIIKSSFSKKNIDQYKLSILCRVDSLCYCVKDQNNAVLLLKELDLFTPNTYDKLQFKVSLFEKAWQEDQNLSLAYPSIDIAFIYPHFTLIPNRLFQENQKATYLAPLKKESDTVEHYFSTDLLSTKAKLVFSIPKNILDFFDGQYAHQVNYTNSITSLIQAIGQKMPIESVKKVWVNVHPNIIQILLFEGKDLLFANQYLFYSEKDFLYYVMLIYNQFKLNPESIPLCLSGQLVKKSAIYKLINQYIRNISFTTISPTHQLDSNLSTSPTYFYFDLLSI